jgi:hypothetical protein
LLPMHATDVRRNRGLLRELFRVLFRCLACLVRSSSSSSSSSWSEWRPAPVLADALIADETAAVTTVRTRVASVFFRRLLPMRRCSLRSCVFSLPMARGPGPRRWGCPTKPILEPQDAR